MLNNAWPALIPYPLPPSSYSPSSFISFIFLLSVPSALITPPSRLTAGWNWNWQSRVRVAGHQGLTVRERERESRWVICHCVNRVTTSSIDRSEQALEFYNCRGAVELDWAWKFVQLHPKPKNSIFTWTKLVDWLNPSEFYNHLLACFGPLLETKPSLPNHKSSCSCCDISVDAVYPLCAPMI